LFVVVGLFQPDDCLVLIDNHSIPGKARRDVALIDRQIAYFAASGVTLNSALLFESHRN
jgi:hypothetical protein